MNFRLIKSLLLLLALCAIIFTSAKDNPQIRDYTKEYDTLLVGSEINYPPYCIINENGEADGFSVELFKAAANSMDMEVKFRTGEWSEVKQSLANGEVDALPLVGRTPEREDIFDFTFPYLTMHGAIVVREENEDIKELADLKNKEVAVMAGDNAEEFVRRSKIAMDIKTAPTFTKALKQLSKGRYDAVVIQRLLAIQLMQKHNIKNLKIEGHPLEEFPQQFCFAVKENNDSLLKLLNEGLSIVMADGTFRRLRTKWFSELNRFRFENREIIVSGDYN